MPVPHRRPQPARRGARRRQHQHRGAENGRGQPAQRRRDGGDEDRGQGGRRRHRHADRTGEPRRGDRRGVERLVAFAGVRERGGGNGAVPRPGPGGTAGGQFVDGRVGGGGALIGRGITPRGGGGNGRRGAARLPGRGGAGRPGATPAVDARRVRGIFRRAGSPGRRRFNGLGFERHAVRPRNGTGRLPAWRAGQSDPRNGHRSSSHSTTTWICLSVSACLILKNRPSGAMS